MKFQENRKINNNSRTMHALLLTEFPLIPSRWTTTNRLCLTGATKCFEASYSGKTGFRYLLRVKLLPTFSYISIVVSGHVGRFSQNEKHMMCYNDNVTHYKS